MLLFTVLVTFQEIGLLEFEAFVAKACRCLRSWASQKAMGLEKSIAPFPPLMMWATIRKRRTCRLFQMSSGCGTFGMRQVSCVSQRNGD